MIYQVTFFVKAPIITTTEIHFDSILYAVSPAAHNKSMQINRFTKSKDVDDLPIPVDCIKIRGDYVYCCSTADYINAHKIVDKAAKRREGGDFLYYQKKQKIAAGINKNYLLKLYGIACESVNFLVSTSNLSSLERYCRRVKAIGGMRKQGYGEVSDFLIEELPNADWRDCIILHNRAIRNIPKCFLDSACNSVARCKPPYWLLDGKMECAVVGEQAILKDDVYLSKFRR